MALGENSESTVWTSVRAFAGTGSMFRIQTWLLVLVLCAGSSEAWLWFSNPEPTTEAPVETTAAALTGATTTANATTKPAEEEEDDNLSGVGEEIINVATGIRKFVEAWNVTPTARTTNGGLTAKVESANHNMTGNTDRFRGERVEEGSGNGVGAPGSGSGSRAQPGSDVESVLKGDKVTSSNLTRIIGDVSQINGTVEGVLDSTPTPPDSRVNGSDPPCLPVPSDWSICSGKGPKSFMLPNFFNHTSVEEVGAVLQEWAWLAREGCHQSAEWFLCLLLAPRCPAPAAPLPQPLPCRSFCHVLQDSCWASLENGRLPVECHLLPERAQEPGRPACASVSNQKGNPGGLECILLGDTF